MSDNHVISVSQVRHLLHSLWECFFILVILRNLGPKTRNDSFGVCEFSGLLKGSEYQCWTWIWKPQFWNPRKPECSQFSVNFFLSNCWFYSLVLYKPQQRNLEFWTYFSVISFWCSAAKEGFQTQLFKTQVLTQTDFENPKKSISNLKKPFSGLL